MYLYLPNIHFFQSISGSSQVETSYFAKLFIQLICRLVSSGIGGEEKAKLMLLAEEVIQASICRPPGLHCVRCLQTQGISRYDCLSLGACQPKMQDCALPCACASVCTCVLCLCLYLSVFVFVYLFARVCFASLLCRRCCCCCCCTVL